MFTYSGIWDLFSLHTPRGVGRTIELPAGFAAMLRPSKPHARGLRWILYTLVSSYYFHKEVLDQGSNVGLTNTCKLSEHDIAWAIAEEFIGASIQSVSASIKSGRKRCSEHQILWIPSRVVVGCSEIVRNCQVDRARGRSVPSHLYRAVQYRTTNKQRSSWVRYFGCRYCLNLI